MTPEQFTYWLQGFFEIMNIGSEEDTEGIHPEQAKIIRDHLNSVFKKETPDRSEKKRSGNPLNLGKHTLEGFANISTKDLGDLMRDIRVNVSC